MLRTFLIFFKFKKYHNEGYSERFRMGNTQSHFKDLKKKLLMKYHCLHVDEHKNMIVTQTLCVCVCVCPRVCVCWRVGV